MGGLSGDTRTVDTRKGTPVPHLRTPPESLRWLGPHLRPSSDTLQGGTHWCRYTGEDREPVPVKGLGTSGFGVDQVTGVNSDQE